MTILMLMTIGLSAQAAELKIGGVSVNLNQNTENGTGGLTAGYYNYFYTTKKLVFYNAKISTIAGSGIYSDVEGLTILFNGDQWIYGTTYGMYLAGDTDMSINSGSVVCNSLFADKSNSQITIRDGGTGEWYFNGTVNFKGKLTIKNTNVNVTGTGLDSPTVISGLDVLEIDNSTLQVNAGSSQVPVLAPVVLKGCVIADVKTVRAKQIEAENSYVPIPQYSASEPAKLYDTKGYLRSGSLTIKPGTAYGLWISGVQLNSENYGNIWQLETMGAAQSIALLSYTPTTKTLKLQATQGIMASLASQYSGFPTIHNEISGLIINSAQGNNYISAASEGGGVAIESLADCTIKGVLNVIGGEYSTGIKTENSNMTIDNATLAVISGGDFGLYGENSKVFVNNSNLTISGSERAIYVENDGFDPDDNCFITVPEGGLNFIDGIYTRDASTGVMTPAKSVQTRPFIKYNLWINGKQVNEVNCNSLISSNAGYSGTMSFTPSTNTLNLNGVNTDIDFNGGNTYIKSTLPTLNINLQGKSYLFGRSSDEGLYATGNVKISGDGYLNFNGQKKAVYVGGSLELTDNAEVVALGKEYGVSTRKLTMSANTKLSTMANPSNQGKSLIIDNTPTFNGVALPSDMRYDSSQKCVVDRTTGAPVSVMVKINADNAAGLVTDINVVSTEQATETTVYSTSGQLLWQGKGQPQLPRGIYIVNGRKVAVR